MRKQYHFWPGEQGLDAWDVDRLIRLSVRLPVRQVALDDLRDLDSAYWFDGGMEVPTVPKIVEHMRFVQEVDPSYPIILGADGRVMDGMHRVARALLEGHPTISAVQFDIDPEPDHRNCRPADLMPLLSMGLSGRAAGGRSGCREPLTVSVLGGRSTRAPSRLRSNALDRQPSRDDGGRPSRRRPR